MKYEITQGSTRKSWAFRIVDPKKDYYNKVIYISPLSFNNKNAAVKAAKDYIKEHDFANFLRNYEVG